MKALQIGGDPICAFKVRALKNMKRSNRGTLDLFLVTLMQSAFLFSYFSFFFFPSSFRSGRATCMAAGEIT